MKKRYNRTRYGIARHTAHTLMGNGKMESAIGIIDCAGFTMSFAVKASASILGGYSASVTHHSNLYSRNGEYRYLFI